MLLRHAKVLTPSYRKTKRGVCTSANRDTIVNRFKADQASLMAVMEKKGKDGWDELWKSNITPWDTRKLGAAPALKSLIRENKVPKGKVLVPGCGSGVDLVELASADRHVVGLELSPTAANIAKQYVTEHGVPESWVEVFVGDFFEFPHANTFDFIYDYTFMAALPVSLRPKWARQCFDLLKAGGLLATLMFPVGKFEGGPPFASLPSDYESLLLPLGFQCEKLEPITESFPARQGREWLGLWRKPLKPTSNQ